METQHGSDPAAVNPGTERIAAFSDGVIAIIITIMVLELRLPEGAAKGDVWPSFLAPLVPKLAIYALSFLIVGALWVNHHQLLAVVRRATLPFMWMNLLLLFFIVADPVGDRLPRRASPVGARRLILRPDHDLELGRLRSAPVSSRSNAGARSRTHSISSCYPGAELHRHADLCGGGDCRTGLTDCSSCNGGIRTGHVQHPDFAPAPPTDLSSDECGRARRREMSGERTRHP